jgi:hypothetical protein
MKNYRQYQRALLASAAVMVLSLLINNHANAGPGVRPVAIVTGGGVAGFDETGGEVVSTFGIGVTIYSDGTAKGHFLCLVHGIVVISGHVTEGRVIGNTAEFSGFGKVNCPGGPNDDPACQDVTFEVTVDQEGGPGVGHYTYFDSFLMGGGGDGTPDPETVIVGQIKIHKL